MRSSPAGISGERGKVGAHSLKWQHAPGGVLTIKEPLRYQASRCTAGMDQALMGTVDTLSMWVYNAEPTTERLRVEFGRGATTGMAFELGLDFTGWPSPLASSTRSGTASTCPPGSGCGAPVRCRPRPTRGTP